MKKKDKTHEELKLEIEKLRAQLAEAEQTLRAIRSGEVDALVVSGEKGEQVFTLKGAEQPYRILIEEMSEGAVMLAADDSILYCNSGFAGMLKTPIEKLIGAGIANYIAPSSESLFLELLRQGREGSSRGEIKLLTGDGTFVSAQFSFNTLQTDDAQFVYLVATDLTEQKRIQYELRRARDELEIRVEERTAELVKANAVLQDEITERKKAEEALRESEKRYRSLFENMMDGFAYCKMLFDDDGLPVDFFCLEINSAFGRLTGLENVAGKKITEIIPGIKESNPELFEIFGRVALTGQPETFEFEFKPLGGWFSTSIYCPEKEYFAVVFDSITERKRAEEALRESEGRLQSILDNSSTVVFLKDLEGRYITVNRRFEELFHVTRQTVVNKSDHDLFPREHADRFRQHDLLALEKGGPIEVEESVPHDDGLHVYISVKFPIFNAEEKPYAICGIATDITERKRAEEALRASEARFRSVLDNSRDVIYRLNMQTGRYEYISPSAETVVGFSPDELMAMDVETSLAMIHPDDVPAMRAELACMEDTGKGELEYRQRTKNGDYCWISNHMSLIKDDAGRLLYRNGNIRDITERKQAEEMLRKAHDELELRVRERTAELKEANKSLQAEINERKKAEEKIREQAELLDKAHDAIGLRNLEQNLIYWNKGAENLYGWTAEEAIGKNADKLLYKGKTSRLIEAEMSVIEKGEWTGELHQVTKVGKEVIVESRWTLIYDSEGKPKSILIINTDITEKKKIESQLLRAQRMESIGTLAGGIAHDLNNMLTPIMLSLEMLKEKFKDEESQKLLTILERNSERGANLIKQVLSFSRGVEGERNPLQARHIITEIEKIAKETFPRNIEIRTDIKKDLFTILGDATQLHQVIMNLCVNARDAMPDGGILNITALNFFIDENYAQMHTEAKVGSYIVIAVSDAGIGIHPEILDRIFEPFFTTKEVGKGTGLGLSTALAIVKSHGGFMNVYSEVGKGTTFRVYFPAIKTEMETAEEQQLELPVGHGELVLVAEDEDSVREITVSTLEAYGYKVVTASDGADAVALYAQNKDKIEVILMDMMMPVMDGEASIRAIRKINPGVKIITVSGLAEKDKLAKIADNRVYAFLPKPYTAERLLKTIREVIGT